MIYLDNVTVGEDADLSAPLQQGTDIGGDVPSVVGFGEHEWGSVRRYDQPVGAAGKHCQCPGALKLIGSHADGHGEAAALPAGLFDQMGDDLAVNIGGEAVPSHLKLGTQLLRVFDDAVVDYRDVAVAVVVGVRISLSDSAVRGPTRVPYAKPRPRWYGLAGHPLA
jgi:hypothetical protein